MLGGIAVLLMALAPPESRVTAPPVVSATLDGTVQPASLRYVERVLRVAADANAALVVFELNTPGGLLVSLRSMTTAITQSQVPVVVYVSPPGGRAASAGFLLLLAADVAAMAPGTNTGAAHPVGLMEPPEEDEDKGEATSPAITKATEDAAALVRSLAAGRGRSVEWAEKAVRQSRAYSADEALHHGLIEIIAGDRGELLRKLDGRTVRRFDGTTVVLRLSGAPVVEVAPTLAERLLMVIADPQVAYLLLLVGFVGVTFELVSPGAIVPGVLGGISLLLAFYALSILPVNWAGLLLIVVGLGLLLAEAVVTSYGLLALAGIVSFVFGSLILVDSPIPELRIGLEVILPATAVLTLASLLLFSRAWRTRQMEAKTGPEAMIGKIGEVVDGIASRQVDGRVFVHGEYWAATADKPLPRGARVQVVRIEGARLRVAPVELPAT